MTTTKAPARAPTDSPAAQRPLGYMTGFGNEFATEALPGALPVGRNSPQKCPYGLYAEQLSGTAFTMPRWFNRRTWTYRIRPGAMHEPFRKVDNGRVQSAFGHEVAPPNQMRWDPLPIPSAPTSWIDGWVTMAGNGGAAAMAGCAVHLYVANASMQGRYFANADGELLVLPQQGRLRFRTELGVLEVAPTELAVIPRGVRFTVELPDGTARGYICENYGGLFRIPDLGAIGSNGLANPRDFETPVAAYEDLEGDFELVTKFMGERWVARIDHSPLDVVAWHGNYAPYRYDLKRFNVIGSISYDHPGPVDLPRAAVAERGGGHRLDRLRRLRAPDPGDAGHLPPAVVPPQRGLGVHGSDPGRLRREGRRLRAGWREPAQLLDGPRSRRDDVRGAEPRRHRQAGLHSRHDGLHVRDLPAVLPDARSTRVGAVAARVLPLLAGTEEALRPEPPVTTDPTMNATYEHLLTETRDRVAIVTLNRPQRLNALSDPLAAELACALQGFDDDPGISVIVVTGSEKAFAAGADIGAMAEWDYAKVYGDDYITKNYEAVRHMRKPVIAAVAGYALGGGCELAMTCDMIIAADTAKFGQPEITIGTMPGMGGTQRLPRAIGKAKAMDWCLTGRMVDAADAERAGLVARVVPADKLMEETLALAAKIASFSLPVVLKIKESINRAYESSLAEGLLFERREFHATFALEDQKEGMRAFVGKRKPQFRHR